MNEKQTQAVNMQEMKSKIKPKADVVTRERYHALV